MTTLTTEEIDRLLKVIGIEPDKATDCNCSLCQAWQTSPEPKPNLVHYFIACTAGDTKLFLGSAFLSEGIDVDDNFPRFFFGLMKSKAFFETLELVASLVSGENSEHQNILILLETLKSGEEPSIDLVMAFLFDAFHAGWGIMAVDKRDKAQWLIRGSDSSNKYFGHEFTLKFFGLKFKATLVDKVMYQARMRIGI